MTDVCVTEMRDWPADGEGMACVGDRRRLREAVAVTARIIGRLIGCGHII